MNERPVIHVVYYLRFFTEHLMLKRHFWTSSEDISKKLLVEESLIELLLVILTIPVSIGLLDHPSGFDSDHFPVCFVIKKMLNRPKNSQRLAYQYNKADLNGLRNTLSHFMGFLYIL